MRLVATRSDGTEVVYDENIWTGKGSLTIGGESGTKIGKRLFSFGSDAQKSEVTIKGSFLTGLTLIFSGGEQLVLAKNKWYEWILIFLPLIGFAVGVTCGAIGGGLSALFGMLGAFFNAYFLRTGLNIFLKIIACIAIAAAVFFIWVMIYVLIVGGLATAFPSLFGN